MKEKQNLARDSLDNLYDVLCSGSTEEMVKFHFVEWIETAS